jgi:hypothetical protein
VTSPTRHAAIKSALIRAFLPAKDSPARRAAAE